MAWPSDTNLQFLSIYKIPRKHLSQSAETGLICNYGKLSILIFAGKITRVCIVDEY